MLCSQVHSLENMLSQSHHHAYTMNNSSNTLKKASGRWTLKQQNFRFDIAMATKIAVCLQISSRSKGALDHRFYNMRWETKAGIGNAVGCEIQPALRVVMVQPRYPRIAEPEFLRTQITEIRPGWTEAVNKLKDRDVSMLTLYLESNAYQKDITRCISFEKDACTTALPKIDSSLKMNRRNLGPV